MRSDYIGNFIAKVEIDFDDGQGRTILRRVIVVPDAAEARIEYLSLEDRLAKSILQAHENGLDSFYYAGRKHRIIKCQLTIANEERENSDPLFAYRLHVVGPQIYIKHDARCWVCFPNTQQLESVTAQVANGTALINVLHCPQCGSYFIDKESLKGYEKKYGSLGLSPIEYCEENQAHELSYLSLESKFKKAGYSVAHAIFPSERHDALRRIIDENIATKTEVIRHLNDLIRRNKNHPRMQRAILAWGEDLSFVNDIGLNEQSLIKTNAPLLPK